MLVTNNLVFIHLTKCGGTFIRSALQKVDAPDRYSGRFHGPWSELPNQFRNMPVLTSVRNPYDWWVSWYHHMKVNEWFNPIARAAVDSGHESFHDMLNFFCDSLVLGSDASIKVDSAIKALIDDPNVMPNDFNFKMIEHMRHHQCGVLSWRYAFQLQDIPEQQLTVIKQESLLNDLKLALVHSGCVLDDVKYNLLTSLPKANTTQRNRNYRDYYNESSQAAVAKLDKMVIEKYGYKF